MKSFVIFRAHRLWAHRSYKARLPLRILLTIFNTMAFQDCVIHWARDHRVHHKYSETDADPHNATRYGTYRVFLQHFLIFFDQSSNDATEEAFKKSMASRSLIAISYVKI